MRNYPKLTSEQYQALKKNTIGGDFPRPRPYGGKIVMNIHDTDRPKHYLVDYMLESKVFGVGVKINVQGREDVIEPNTWVTELIEIDSRGSITIKGSDKSYYEIDGKACYIVKTEDAPAPKEVTLKLWGKQVEMKVLEGITIEDEPLFVGSTGHLEDFVKQELFINHAPTFNTNSETHRYMFKPKLSEREQYFEDNKGVYSAAIIEAAYNFLISSQPRDIKQIICCNSSVYNDTLGYNKPLYEFLDKWDVWTLSDEIHNDDPTWVQLAHLCMQRSQKFNNKVNLLHDLRTVELKYSSLVVQEIIKDVWPKLGELKYLSALDVKNVLDKSELMEGFIKLSEYYDCYVGHDAETIIELSVIEFARVIFNRSTVVEDIVKSLVR